MKIYEKLMNIQSELKAPKGQFNSFGKYKYRSCEDILESLKPLLAKNKTSLMITDEVKQIGDRFYIKATAILVNAEDGENVSVSALAREDETKKGMDLAQVTGSVSSYARKYALNGLFCIDDTKDSDSTNTHGKNEDKPTNNEDKSTNKEDKPKQLSEGQVKRLFAIANSKGITPEQVKKGILKDYSKINVEDLTKKEYDELCSRLENAKAN